MSVFGGGGYRRRPNYERNIPDGPALKYFRENVKLSPFSGKPVDGEFAKREAIELHNRLADSNQSAIRGQPDPNLKWGSQARTNFGGIFNPMADEEQSRGLARHNTNQPSAEALAARRGWEEFDMNRAGYRTYNQMAHNLPIPSYDLGGASAMRPPRADGGTWTPPTATTRPATETLPAMQDDTGLPGADLGAVPDAPVAAAPPAAIDPAGPVEPVAFDWEPSTRSRQRQGMRRLPVSGGDWNSFLNGPDTGTA